MELINLPRLDPAPVETSKFPDEMNKWFSDTVDLLNTILDTITQDFSNIIADQSVDIGGGGAGPIDVSVPGLTATSVVTASIVSSSNPVSIISVVPGIDKFSVTFSGNPGASAIISYIAFIAPFGG